MTPMQSGSSVAGLLELPFMWGEGQGPKLRVKEKEFQAKNSILKEL